MCHPQGKDMRGHLCRNQERNKQEHKVESIKNNMWLKILLLPVISMHGPIFEASFSMAAAAAHDVWSLPLAHGTGRPRPVGGNHPGPPGRTRRRWASASALHSPFSQAPTEVNAGSREDSEGHVSKQNLG